MKEQSLSQQVHEVLDKYYFQPGHALWRILELRLLRQVTELYQTDNILDIGSGDGTYAQILFKKPIRVGIDIGDKEIERSRQCGMYHKVIKASASKLPFPDSIFEIVFSNCVFEHIPQQDLSITETVRVLKPGGLFVATVVSELMTPDIQLRKELNVVHTYSPQEWHRRLNKTGLKIEKESYYFSRSADDFYRSSLLKFNRPRHLNLFYLAYFFPTLFRKILVNKYYPRLLELCSQDNREVEKYKGYGYFFVARKVD